MASSSSSSTSSSTRLPPPQSSQPLLLSIPSTLFYHSIIPFLPTSNLLSLRAACRGCHSLLHSSDNKDNDENSEADKVWKDALARDFHFIIPPSSSPSPSSPPSCHYLDTLRVSNERRMSGNEKGGNNASVFGCVAPNAVFRAKSAFDSWRNWRRAARRYYSRNFPSSSSLGSSASSSSSSSSSSANKTLKRREKDVKNQEEQEEEDDDECLSLHGPYFLRAAKLWSKIEEWCDSPNSQKVGKRMKQSFMHGLSHFECCNFNSKIRRTFEEEHDNSNDDSSAENVSSIGMKNTGNSCGRGLWALQAIYAFHGGQHSFKDERSIFRGLLGGYSAYNNIVCTGLLNLQDSERFSSVDRFRPDCDAYIPIASSFNHRHVFEVHIPTGRVYLQNSHRIPAVPGPSTVDGRYDSVLVWLEEFASRLSNGLIGVERMFSTEPVTESLILYPTIHDKRTFRCSTTTGSSRELQRQNVPVTSRAVTRGVEVVASSVYAADARMHVYSIRIKLLTPGEEGYQSPEQRGFHTCQLHSRHWQIIDSDENSIDEVRGDGVIGLYPLLMEGGYRHDAGNAADDIGPPGAKMEGTFRYQSCSGPVCGSFGGWLQFVPGSLENPKGRDFDVRVAPFALNNAPDYVF